jgi:hypothetical protein
MANLVPLLSGKHVRLIFPYYPTVLEVSKGLFPELGDRLTLCVVEEDYDAEFGKVQSVLRCRETCDDDTEGSK